MWKTAKNFVTYLVQKAKTLFFNSNIEAAKSSKELYLITDKLCGKNKTCSLPSIFPAQSLPNIFSEFFSNKVSDLRKEIDAQPTTPHTLGSKFTGVPFSSFAPVTESDVLKILKKSAPKSCDLDPIPTTLLFDCVDVVLPYLTKIINESLISGIFPEVHKTALVTPLLKKVGLDQNVLKNYRPVSNLSFVSKVIEKIVLSQLSGHLSVNKLFSMYQSAYRPGHSTETALVKILNDLLMSMDKGKVSLLTLLDLSAAFDTIDHGILISRLEHVYGISGSALSWFSSYLQDRTKK